MMLFLVKIKNLAPYFFLIALYFFFVNLEFTRNPKRFKQENMTDNNRETDLTTNSNKEYSLKIDIPVIPFIQK